MAAPIRVPFRAHFDFRALSQIRVMESFAHGEFAYAGVQSGAWRYDEFFWSERKGAWGGQEAPARHTVSELSLLGAGVESQAFADFGDEPLLRLGSGATLVGRGTILYGNAGDVPSVFELYSCSTGALVAQAGSDGALGGVPDGSYLLWSRFVGGAIIQTPYGECQRYEGEWSAVRVVVGGGAWSLAPGICPSPGFALYRKPYQGAEVVVTGANASAHGVTFDPLARSVSSSCQLRLALRQADGTFFLPAGTFLVAGLRASRSGPQTALWVLRANGTARLLGVQADLSNGFCECGKTNHNAVDVVQSPDGELFVLSECALFRFDPDALSLDTSLVGFPLGTRPEPGHPGGNCLRFPQGEMIHWTENFGGVSDGTAHYNRMVRRVGGRDLSGPSTLWHGTNCAEEFLGRFWAIRADDEQTLYLDWLEGGRWHGYAGMRRPIAGTFWQRLRAVGNALFLFGFKPGSAIGHDTTGHTDGSPIRTEKGELVEGVKDAQSGAHAGGDTPTCAVADGLTLRDASLPFFVRRATVDGDQASLFVAARGSDEGIGPANRVVEIDASDGGHTRVCSFWDQSEQAFEMSRTQFEALGGDLTKLPSFWAWQARSGSNGSNGGGRWRAVSTEPTQGYWLETSVSGATIRLKAQPGGTLPYSPEHFGQLCFEILSDGSVDSPSIEPTCPHAQCVLEALPPGSRFRVLVRPVPDPAKPLSALQITDPSYEGRLRQERDTYPTLWLRIDSDADLSDLESYTFPVFYGHLIVLPQVARKRVDVVVLVTPDNQPLEANELPLISRRA